MKIGRLKVNIFKIKNRKGYAAVCAGNLTEGRSRVQAYDRMQSAAQKGGKQNAGGK